MTDDNQKTGAIPSIQDPIDPNNDMTDVTDTHGMAGMTQNFTPNQSSTAPEQKDATPPTSETMSQEMIQRANDVGSEPDPIASSSAIPNPSPSNSLQDQMFQKDEFDPNEVSEKTEEPYLEDNPSEKEYRSQDASVVAASMRSTNVEARGEQSISGDMSSPESDDDTLENAQAMGFQLDENSEDPQPLNMGKQFDEGEKAAHE